MAQAEIVDLGLILAALALAWLLLRLALSELRLWNRHRHDKRARALYQTLRRQATFPSPETPRLERRKSSRLCGGGRAWVDPEDPTVINLADRRRRT